MKILGISAFYHDSAAAITIDGEVIAAMQEERCTRQKNYSGFPLNAVAFCLDWAKVEPSEIDYVVFYEKPIQKFERLLETYNSFAPMGFTSFRTSMPLWIKDKLFQKKKIIKALCELGENERYWRSRLLFNEHHLSHAASAFFPSPFSDAAIVTIDGVGEWPTTTISVGKKSNIERIKEIHYPHSLGLLYSAFTSFLGFKINEGEYKMMGLAPYGEPIFVSTIKDELIHIFEDGSFQLNMDYFDFCTGLKMTNQKFQNLFGFSERATTDPLEQPHLDMSASIQTVTEEVVLKIVKHAKELTGQQNLCMAGGVALNCVANAKINKQQIFKDIWVQPAAGDAGAAIGAALSVDRQFSKEKQKSSDLLNHAYLGPEYGEEDIEEALTAFNCEYTKFESEKDLIAAAAEAIASGEVIGWMQGRMEFGPRALGNRSILADARNVDMQKNLNLKIKYRESFRPFAPSVLEEHAADWFDLKVERPYMTFVADVLKKHHANRSEGEMRGAKGLDTIKEIRSSVPAITHVDFSARVQTVSKRQNPLFHSLIFEFFKNTGCPMVINTSFNVNEEPIVCSPKDAINCFIKTDMDKVFVGRYMVNKQDL